MLRRRVAFFCLLVAGVAVAQESEEERAGRTERWSPRPPKVTPGRQGTPPSDALVLFDGTGLDAWEGEGGPADWEVAEGVLTIRPGSGDIRTRRGFGDAQLHLEWRTPARVEGSGQGRGNSGIFLMSRYEVQVLDSYANETYANGQAGSIYKQHTPLVNASRGPGEWQTYDIVFRVPRFDGEGRLLEKATMTVLHNGVLIQNHAILEGATVWIGEPVYEAHGPSEPLLLQDHGNRVSYRNIWIREIPSTSSLR